MKQIYTNTLSQRQRLLWMKFKKLQGRLQAQMNSGDFKKFSRRKQWKALRTLRRYALRLQRLGMELRIAATGTALALALLMGNPIQAQTFTEQTGVNNPFDGVDVGFRSAPAFVDIDGDGDGDAFFGEHDGTINYYKNTGTPLIPTFTEQTGANNPFNGVDVGASSTPAFVDIDGDGDLDAFIGKFEGKVKYYENTGTATSPTFIEQTGANNPLNSVSLYYHATPTFVDVDSDGDMDAFIGEFDGTINYYKNTGTAINPTFTSQTGGNNPFNGVDVGGRSTPSFVDMDSDGDMDAFLGEDGVTINYYKNTGTPISPTFTEQTGGNNPFNGLIVGSEAKPNFVDIDCDGDMDVFIGELYGVINYYKNTFPLLDPAFTEQTGANNPFDGEDVGDGAAPNFVDVDSDGDMDAFIGEDDGIINYYKNTGTVTNPTFTVQTGGDNPFNGVDVGYYSSPVFVDIDGDGDMDAFIGEDEGIINYYKNTGTVINPTFTVQTGMDNPFNGVNIGYYSSPTFVDIDSDGDMDAFIGEFDGVINYYKNTGTAINPTFTVQTGMDNPFNGVDVGSGSTPNFADIDSDGDMDAFIGESDGVINYYKNTGTVTNPTFTVQTGGNNPFNGVDVGFGSKPAIVDIDSDCAMDAFIGESSGTIKYYKNTGALLPVELTELSAILQNETTLLHWQTATEINNHGFEIQRAVGSELGRGVWTKIGYVEGYGTSLVERDYLFVDEAPKAGVNYYRLKQVDLDGVFEYSRVVSVDLLNPGDLENLRVRPNPVSNGSFQLTLPPQDFEGGRLSILDGMGRLVRQEQILEANVMVQVGDLPAGIYSVLVELDGQRFLERVVIQ